MLIKASGPEYYKYFGVHDSIWNSLFDSICNLT